MEPERTAITEFVSINQQDVGPFQRPEVGVLLAPKQPLHTPSPFVRPCVGEKRADLFRRRHHAEQVE